MFAQFLSKQYNILKILVLSQNEMLILKTVQQGVFQLAKKKMIQAITF